jgi:activator of HSP90 ATPase
MKDYKKYYQIPAPPEEVYAALTNPLSIQLWTGEAVTMSTEPGSEFSLWDGSIIGKNIEFEQDKKLVQQWYFGDENPESIVTIKLHYDKGNSTSLELKHSNIPDADYDDIVEGWNHAYIAGLLEFFGE